MSEKHADMVAEQETRRVETAAVRSGLAFRAYMQHSHLSPFDVALVARVRYVTVWNIAQGIPVRAAHAACVGMALHKLTGVPYTAPIIIRAMDHL
jgi:hypothetical protein